jgi:hypothetical protein
MRGHNPGCSRTADFRCHEGRNLPEFRIPAFRTRPIFNSGPLLSFPGAWLRCKRSRRTGEKTLNAMMRSGLYLNRSRVGRSTTGNMQLHDQKWNRRRRRSPEHPVVVQSGWSGGFLNEPAYPWVRSVDSDEECTLPFAVGLDLNTVGLSTPDQLHRFPAGRPVPHRAGLTPTLVLHAGRHPADGPGLAPDAHLRPGARLRRSPDRGVPAPRDRVRTWTRGTTGSRPPTSPQGRRPGDGPPCCRDLAGTASSRWAFLQVRRC